MHTDETDVKSSALTEEKKPVSSEAFSAKPDQRVAALDLYLESRGKLSMTSIAKKVGVTRQTVARWIATGKWSEKVSSIERKLDEKVAEKIAEKATDAVAEKYLRAQKQQMEFYNLFTHILMGKLIQTDESGRPLKDAAGNILPANPSASDMQKIGSAMSDAIKTIRLIQGKPTEIQASPTLVEEGITETEKEKREAFKRFIRRNGHIEDPQKFMEAVLEDAVFDPTDPGSKKD